MITSRAAELTPGRSPSVIYFGEIDSCNCVVKHLSFFFFYCSDNSETQTESPTLTWIRPCKARMPVCPGGRAFVGSLRLAVHMALIRVWRCSLGQPVSCLRSVVTFLGLAQSSDSGPGRSPGRTGLPSSLFDFFCE